MSAEPITIYHNPRCSKSRETLALIRKSGMEPVIVEYLKEVPTKAELQKILAQLHVPVETIVRQEEQMYKSQLKGKAFNEDEWIQILRENPKLIQRPIVIRGSRGVIGRPPENVKKLL
jgi:arsenate reductase